MATGDELAKITAIIKNINDFRTEVAKLDLDPRERAYYDAKVFPLLQTFNDVSNGTENIAEGLKNIALILRKSKIKQGKDLVVDTIDVSEDVFEVLRKKINVLIEIAEST